MNTPISVIVVSYNNFNTTTGPCLESLVTDPAGDRLEIVVVDNASQDETPEKLKAVAAKLANVKLVLNQNNRGFSGGNNDGVAVATGDIVILLNSDTRVLPGAMGRLADLLVSHDDWGLVSPVTNEAGNEQKIYTTGRTPAEILAEGRAWCQCSRDFHFESERLDFSCVAMRRATYNELGGLDEDFGLGYYEDTDFSQKARKQGCRMMVTEDVFVYHRGSQSFSRVRQKPIKRLRRENRKKLLKKHPEGVVLHHIRDRNLYILKQYVQLMPRLDAQGLSDLRYKQRNRLTFARTLFPNSPLKKIRYYFQLRQVEKDLAGRG